VPPARFMYAESATPTKIDCNPLMAVVGDRWKYIRTTEPELYDLETDPGESHNLATAEPEQLAALARELDSILADRDEGGAARFEADAAMQAELEALGYIARPVDDSLRLDPDRADPKQCIAIFRELGNLALLTNLGRFEEARAVAKQLLAIRPDLADVYRYLGVIASEERIWSEAVSHLRLYIALAEARVDGPRGSGGGPPAVSQIAEARVNLGLCYGELGRFKEALASLDAAISMAPELPRAHYNRGFALLKLNRRGEAIEEFRRVLQLDPEHALARAQLAELGIEVRDE
jgi:tetratricopeptide (TPR) repeat protein